MLHRDESVGVNRLQVVGPDGEDIGGVEAMYVDGDTSEPEFALVGFGFFRLRHAFVPMEGAWTEGDNLHVRYSKRMVKDAPYLHADERIDDRGASALYAHYGIDPSSRRSAPAPPRAEPRAEPAEAAPTPRAVAAPTPRAVAAPTLRAVAAPTPRGDAAPAPVEPEPAEPEPADPEPVGTADEQARAAAAPDERDGDSGQPAARDSEPREPAGDETMASLEGRTVDELRHMASDREIPGRSSMNKQQLVEALSRSDGKDERSGADRAYEDRTVDELRQLAADRDISGRWSMNKRELIDALREH